MSLIAKVKQQLQTRKVQQAADAARIESAREKAEAARARKGEAHVVEYFHQIDDPYSHLAAQCLATLQARYNIVLKVHLVSAASADERRAPEAYDQSDCVLIAPYYGLEYAPVEGAPEHDLRDLALAIVSNIDVVTEPKLLVEIGDALWHSDTLVLEDIAKERGKSSPAQVEEKLREGDARRSALGFCDAGSFYYGGEWYLHIDRLYHLENRLTGLGVRRSSGRKLVTPRPVLRADRLSENHGLVLDAYLALDNPECAVAFARMQRLVRDSGVVLKCFPVRTTLHSGPSVESDYERHRLLDLTREAHALGLSRAGVAALPSQKKLDQALYLWHWAQEHDKATEFLAAYYNAVFFDGYARDGIDSWKSLVKQIGLKWDSAHVALTSQSEAALEAEQANHDAIDASGFDRFPVLRLRGSDGVIDTETIGHDRLWLVAKRMNHRNFYADDGFGL